MNKLLLTSFILVCSQSLCISCAASDKKEFKTILTANKENGYAKVLNDSVANIILDAKRVTCYLQSKTQEDTLRQDSVNKLPSKVVPVFQYLILRPENFSSDHVVYGNFENWVCMKIEASRKKVIFIELDFGLSKWKLLDADKKQILQRDMKENNILLLDFVRMLFPNDLSLKILYNNLTTKI